MDGDRSFDEVDPRVQIELERLNTATDDINKLEVDLDEARAGFRQLLCESTVRIDALGKKLGACIERSRPYYDARIKAKDALQETQEAAVRFERANSAHSAAREMVFLAEEGLSTEGRTFDHAWQEMLNHATMRVNESESERTLSEVEHRRTSQSYHRAEMRVQQLQKELKRAIAKSSLNARRSMLQISSVAYRYQLMQLPYFEMKAQFNQLLEDQKKRVKSLEGQVGQAKTTYAQALRNLEQISDEIHRTRKYESSGIDPLGARGAGVGADSPLPLPITESRQLPPGSPSESSCSGEEFLTLPDKLGPASSPNVTKNCTAVSARVSEYLGLSSLSQSRDAPELPIRSQATMSPRHTVLPRAAQPAPAPRTLDPAQEPPRSMKRDDSQTWTEISLAESPEEARPFAKMGQVAARMEPEERESGLAGLLRNPLSFTLPNRTDVPASPARKVANWMSLRSDDDCAMTEEGSPPDEASNVGRRQSLDVLFSGERVKELLNHGMMMLNIASLSERRASEPRNQGDEEEVHTRSYRDYRLTKKVPSPLEKSLTYLNAEDDSQSDSESLASVEMLTDEQITSLMLEQDLQDACEHVLGTPLSEICPLIEQLRDE